MRRNRAIFIAVFLVFSSMRRKLFFLMFFVLLVTLVGNAFGAGGLTGDYYHTSAEQPGPPSDPWQTFVLSRVDATVNFDWGTGSPGGGVSDNDFAVRWTGGVVPVYSEDYTFGVEVDDGGRLWVDGQLIIDSWQDQSPTWYYSNPIPLISGREYEIKMEWYERGGSAVARLGWRSASQAQQFIPSSQLNPVFKQRWAHDPNPPHQAIDVIVDANLSWTRGIYVLQDEVYFGTDPCALDHVATIPALPTFPPLYAPPGDLVASTTYYWQIVETDANLLPWPSPVWNFCTVRGEAQAVYPAHGAVIKGDNYPLIPPHTHIYTPLDFIPGETAETFTGYFSKNRDDVLNRVQDANLGEPPYTNRYYVGNPSFDPYTDSLVRGTAYYWAVDSADARGNMFPGDIWEFGIQGYKAFGPSPPNEAIFVEPDVLLEWRAGYSANQHDVYMSSSWDDVNDAVYDANTPPPEFLTTTMEPNHMVTGLARGVKQYWRVDEVIGRLLPFPGTIYKGDVWEFTTQIFASEYRDKGYLYLSPVPRAEYVLPNTRFVLVRFEAISPGDLTNLSTFIAVTGGASGPHAGQTRIATDDRTVIFEVSTSFSSEELVTVTLTPTVDPCVPAVVEPYQYQFMVSGPMPLPPPPTGVSTAREEVMNGQAMPEAECEALPTSDIAKTSEDGILAAAADGPMIMENGVSVPSDFPHVNVTINNNPAPGYIFLDYRGGPTTYAMILDNSGAPVWYRRGTRARDFKVQKNGIVTWTNFQGYDQNFNYLRSFGAVNGYGTDDHELQVLEDGGYLLIGQRSSTVDMSLYVPDGRTDASVRETIVQEFTAASELIFQWRAWDNFDVRDVHLDNIKSGSFRFPHMNAIDIDEDGHILLSSRHLSEVTKINRDTGEIIWRLSGIPKNNDFTFVNDPLNGFRNQHDIRSMGNGRYTIFDNGNLHNPSVSRAVEYELDLNAMTATLVWEFRDTPDKYTHYMGNAQRLPNGNTLINFVLAQYPKVIEVNQNGEKEYEMSFAGNSADNYRTFRFPWEGMVEAPYLVVESPPDSLTLLFNKFGDPNVAYYRIYGGTTPQPTTLLDTSASTLKNISEGLENGLRYYFRVTAVDIHGRESGYSNEESAVVSFIEPGQNVVLNGDFCQEKNSWTWSVGSSASAQWNIESGVSHFDITTGGTQISHVQLRQAGIRLVRGKEYIFEFDARSDLPRIIEAKVGQDQSPWTNYSKIGYSTVTPNLSHFRYPFTMQDPSDNNARVVFNTGTSDIDVYIDNVSLITVLAGDFDFDNCARFEDLAVLTGEWLEESSGLTADLQVNGRIDFNDFAIFADSFKYPCSTILVTEKDAKRVLVPTINIGYNWIGNAEPYDDTGWVLISASDCPTGVGYEDHPGDAVNYTDLIAHDVGAQMSGNMTSCYIRIPFTLNIDPNELNSITLKMRYDDGFVAYINGKELTRDNFDALIPEWNDNADRLHDDDEARLLQPFRVNRVDDPNVFNALQLGDNILAIHGLNVSTGSSDFLISEELHAGD